MYIRKESYAQISTCSSITSPNLLGIVGWKLLFATSWGRFQRQFNNILENMKRHEDLIDREANAHNISEAYQMRQELYAWREESKERLLLQDKEQSAKEFQAIRSWLQVNEAEQPTILESVSEQGNLRYQGTCEWIFNNAKIKAWLRQPSQTQILWLSGTAGSGKSVISTQLIQSMKSSPNLTVLYHLCTQASMTSCTYDQILKSLLEQLLRQDADLTAHVYYEYVLKKHLPTVSAIEQLLRTLLMSYSADPNQSTDIRIVLDGVDELPDHSPNSQAHLLRFMKQLASHQRVTDNTACKILISSRPSTTVVHELRRNRTISLTEEKECLQLAIQNYALQRLKTLHRRFQQLGIDASEIEDISQQISEKADGKLTKDLASSPLQGIRDNLENMVTYQPSNVLCGF